MGLPGLLQQLVPAHGRPGFGGSIQLGVHEPEGIRHRGGRRVLLRFKQVNDAYGHQTGDTVLRDIAAAIHSCIRSTDTLIRYGGDEFLLLFPKMDKHIFTRKQNEIREAVRRIVIPEHPELHLSVSIGGVSGVHPLAEAIRQADYLMYENKEKYYTEGEHVTPPPPKMEENIEIRDK